MFTISHFYIKINNNKLINIRFVIIMIIIKLYNRQIKPDVKNMKKYECYVIYILYCIR